jgi:hypothetical protein
VKLILHFNLCEDYSKETHLAIILDKIVEAVKNIPQWHRGRHPRAIRKDVFAAL